MSTAKALESCIELVSAPYRDWQGRYPGHRAMGYFCTYAPLELLHAAGLAPLRLMQSSGPVAVANAHLPPFCCALARATTERMLSGELAFLQGVLFVQTCDTMQCLADVWRMAKAQLRAYTFSPPAVLDNAGSRAYCIAELQRLARALEDDHGVVLDEQGLQNSIRLYNEQRRLLNRVYSEQGRFSGLDRWTLTLAAMLMPVEAHNALLRQVLDSVEDAPAEHEGPSVYLVGAVLDDPTVVQLIAELGGCVVGDDLCTGSRYFETLVDEGTDPYAALADRLLRRVPCPSKHRRHDERRARLVAALEASGAQGVIFLLPKFCEPHAFDYVPLSHAVEKLGLGQLLIETDVTVPREALRTRLQAFIEMLQEQGGASSARQAESALAAAQTT